MQLSKSTNLCIRCSKQRVVLKTYKEMLGNSEITIHEYTCPDPECQKVVDLQLLREREKRNKIQQTNSFYNNRRNINLKKKVS